MSRYLLKLSGEALGGASGMGVDPDVLDFICNEIKGLLDKGAELSIVLGGGNLFRGSELAARGMDHVAGDRMGMLATVMNGLALADFLTRMHIDNLLLSAIPMPGTVAGYERQLAQQAIAAGKVVILTGGTGNPFFTTDTTACLRGIELQVDAVLKATNVDGVYSADPKRDSNATRYDTITYDEVLTQNLRVMDLTAIVLCRDHQMPLVVFDMNQANALVDLANGATVGTRIVAS